MRLRKQRAGEGYKIGVGNLKGRDVLKNCKTEEIVVSLNLEGAASNEEASMKSFSGEEEPKGCT